MAYLWLYRHQNVSFWAGWQGRALPKRMKRDKNEAAKNILDLLPDWVGYGALYLLISVPVIITIAVVALLFVTSLK